MMLKSISMAALALLLAACSEVSDQFASLGTMTTDSENCRSEVSMQLSRESIDLKKTSDQEKFAYDQRYRFCMAEKGYELPSEQQH